LFRYSQHHNKLPLQTAIGKAIAYAPASRLHLSVHITGPPARHQAHAVGGVAAADWLAATLGGGDVNAGGADVRTSDLDNGLFPGFEVRDISASPWSYLLTLSL